MTKRKTTSRAKKPVSEIPEKIYAQVSPKSAGGVSMFEAGERINAQTAPNFFSEENLINTAVFRLQQAGFEVLQVSQSTNQHCWNRRYI